MLRAAAPRFAGALRTPIAGARSYATPAAAKSTPYLLYGLVGAGLLGGGYYATTLAGSPDYTTVKVAATPKEVDYQAVYNA